ncbi:hypothetical protein CP556_20065 [Natrinema sp. CBA1119]|uniref:hypothetical protein n=1 Tax=Natrinema sp. CBA1119 TaxID=1608465 RepID=UPI000BF69DD6|nr:hypothetical protein [Natrinema sp. CBA1119]PGF14442.1 hypothetical protein CP556_20065 [Natrinema sp. CBA1119]
MSRILVIFRNTVFNVEVRHGILESAGQVSIEVLDAPLQAAATGNMLIEQFLKQLETTTETDWRDTPADN